MPAVLPYELRHIGATLAAATGATTQEPMGRLGHPLPAAAFLYQHAADDRDADIARALDAMLGAITEATDDNERADSRLATGDWSRAPIHTSESAAGQRR